MKIRTTTPALIALLLFIGSLLGSPAPKAWGQVACTTIGQNPATAFPVCGTGSFRQNSVNLCGGRRIPNPRCATTLLSDVNPYWYRFTCFADGTLGFTIIPNSATSDYDWQVFDITNRNPDDVFTDASLTIASNWSQYYGNTGTTATAANFMECEGPVPQFSRMPNIVRGRTYLLLVSHFTNSQAGYRLEFGGGTAIITDTTVAAMNRLTVQCGGTAIGLKLNKRMLCSSLATNGSDFTILNSAIQPTSATAIGCNNGFDFDSVVLQFATPVPPGSFTLASRLGTDGNTLLDVCSNALAPGSSLPFTVLPVSTSIMSAQQPTLGCMPTTLRLLFTDALLCNTLANDGSDFEISGPQPGLRIMGIDKLCMAGGSTNPVDLRLSTAITVGGSYTIRHRAGTDGNTSTSVCAIPTTEQQVVVQAANQVSAATLNPLLQGCTLDTLVLQARNPNQAATYTWYINGQPFSNTPDTFYTYAPLPNRRIQFGLVVTNGVCTDSAMNGELNTGRVVLQARPATVGPAFACPAETISFADSSTGSPTAWRWSFGNGATSTAQHPAPQRFTPAASQGVLTYTVRLWVANAQGCADSATLTVQAPNNCLIAVPGGFTPNADGLNDYLYPLNAWRAQNLHFRVYNRYGQLVWETRDWTRRWDGRINGVPQPAGTYVWFLQYQLMDKTITQRGTTVLIR